MGWWSEMRVGRETLLSPRSHRKGSGLILNCEDAWRVFLEAESHRRTCIVDGPLRRQLGGSRRDTRLEGAVAGGGRGGGQRCKDPWPWWQPLREQSLALPQEPQCPWASHLPSGPVLPYLPNGHTKQRTGLLDELVRITSLLPECRVKCSTKVSYYGDD